MAYRLYSVIVVLIILLFLGACENANLSTSPKRTTSVPEATVTELHANESDEGFDEFERGARTLALTGDLDAMLERGYIRVLVPYSKTFFFYEGARPRGLAYEFMEAFGEKLRKGQQGKPIKLAIVYLPMPRSRLIPGIADGLGDIAIAGLTVTDERQQIIEFVPNSNRPVSEVVVTGPGAPRLNTLEDLSGQKVFVRKSSSYYESIVQLNTRLRSAGKAKVKIVEADENLEVEDILELVRAGVEDITVADDFLARLWAGIMGNLDVHEDLVLREAFFIGPVVRKSSPQLVAALGEFQKTHGIGTEFGNVVVNQYLKDNKWARNPSSSSDRKRLEKAIPLFEKYGRQYDLDIQLLVAQGYQESQLDQSTRSGAGAVGVMQIKPSTAAGDPVNIRDVQGNMENNIHAGVKYLRHLIDDYFNDPALTPFNRQLFAIAAYNAGPSRIQSLRQQAKQQGLDSNVWFDNVEIVSAKNIGRQNVDYVRNILKYWVAYRLATDFDKKSEQ